MSLAANTKLGPYVVLGPLKAGGMGEVYRAHDSQLDRTVALKVLRTDLIGDANAIARFQREAKLASSLNHPHIISIYSTHENDGMVCIAMELVDGETLTDWQKTHKPSLGQLLEVFTQIADALAAAHAAGVIHRDIKPANLLVNSQGYAKVLDFGLAKQIVPAKGEISQASTDTNITGANAVMGTPAYMSPEQATAGVVDARTDVFSLGVVLYEATTGVRPFAGDSAVQLFNEVISKQPRSALEIKPSLPFELQWILERALAKEPRERYGSMADFASDLRRLRPKIETGMAETQRPARGRFAKVAAIAALIAVAALGATWIYQNQGPNGPPPALRYEQLTDFNDSTVAPALSPDGRMVAFVRGGAFGRSTAQGEIHVKILPDGDPIQLTRDGIRKHTPTFSPDGTRVIYTRVESSFVWDSWQVPVLGGETTPYLPNASGLTFLNAHEIMFAEIKKYPHMGIMTSRLNRIDQREVYMPPGDGSMAHRAALSPDRKWVLVVEMDGAGWLPCRLLPFDGSSAGRQVGPLASQCTTASWSPDGKWMYFSSDAGGGFHIWRQAFPDGAPQQITAESNEQEGTAVAPDGKSLVTSAGTSQGAIWIHDKQGDRQLTFQGSAIQPRMAPDGRTIYYLQRAGAARAYVSAELWVLDLASGRKERILPGFLMSHFDLSRDGVQVLFTSAGGDTATGIWIADLDRQRPPRQLTKGGEFRAFFTGPDELVFLSNDSVRYLYAMRTDGSPATRLHAEPVNYLLNVSPDGKWGAVALGVAGKEGGIVKLFPLRNNPYPTTTTFCQGCIVGFGPGRQDAPLISWTNDSKSVLLSLKFGGMQSKRTALLPFDPLQPEFDRGARNAAEVAKLPGARLIDEENVFPARRPGEYLMSRQSASTNLFRITLRE